MMATNVIMLPQTIKDAQMHSLVELAHACGNIFHYSSITIDALSFHLYVSIRPSIYTYIHT